MMSDPWKTSWNFLSSMFLFGLSAWMTWDDYRYPGEILFLTSPAMVLLVVVATLWFLISHFVSVFPKRFLFPVVILLVSRLSMGFPLNLQLENNEACFYVSAALTLTCGIYFLGSVFQFLSVNRRPWFQLRHSLTVLFVGIFLAVASIPMNIAGMITSAQNFVGDYARISLTSISLLERVFAKDGTKVFLIGMMHIGEQDFYDEVRERMSEGVTGKRVVLSEGVTDREGILPQSFASGNAYSKWAQRFGLKAQDSELPRKGVARSSEEIIRDGVTILNADIDVSELSSEHQRLLTSLLEAADTDNFADLLAGPRGITGPELEDLMVEGLIGFRNERLMAKFDQAIQDGAKELFIPWGAAHLPDIEKRLVEQGFEKIYEERRPVVRFWNRGSR